MPCLAAAFWRVEKGLEVALSHHFLGGGGCLAIAAVII